MHLLFPLASSILYVVAAMFLKQAAERRVGVWRTAFVCNWLTAAMFFGLWPLGGTIPEGAQFWQPVVVALLYLAGQLFTFLALDQGDVSVATPVLGSKVILVALFSVLILGTPLRWQLWMAAVMSCAGIGLLHRGQGAMPHRRVGRTIALAFQAAMSYALFDVLVMQWAPAWGMGRFLPLLLLMAGVCSFGFVPMFRQPLWRIPVPARKPLLFGAFFIALQGFILISTVARYGDATSVNVVYSSRGLWSVLGVWWLGRWFGNTEHEQGREVFRWRLAGATLIAASIVLLFL